MPIVDVCAIDMLEAWGACLTAARIVAQPYLDIAYEDRLKVSTLLDVGVRDKIVRDASLLLGTAMQETSLRTARQGNFYVAGERGGIGGYTIYQMEAGAITVAINKLKTWMQAQKAWLGSTQRNVIRTIYGSYLHEGQGLEDKIAYYNNATEALFSTLYDAITDGGYAGGARYQLFSMLNMPNLIALLARMYYLTRPGNIPETVEEQAAYYKREWNTAAGKATVEQYIHNYRKIYQLALLIQQSGLQIPLPLVGRI